MLRLETQLLAIMVVNLLGRGGTEEEQKQKFKISKLKGAYTQG
jgi:hypothetical protein